MTIRRIAFILAVIVLMLLAFVAGRAQERQRLELHATFNDGNLDVLLFAICDTGNGAMVYVVRRPYATDTSVAAVPNGCTKRLAEKEQK